MSEFFDRQVRVVAGDREFSGLYTEFEVQKDDKEEPNSATITIHNLSPDSAAAVRGLVQLYAGYRDQVDLIFVGDVTRAITTVEGTGSRTTIESGDGQAALAGTVSSISIKGDTDLRSVLREAVKGLASDPAAALSGLGDLADVQIPRGYSASGPTKQVLRGLARARGFDWFFRDGELKIVPKGQATQEPAVRLTPDTGLVESPARTPDGVQIKSLLNGRILPRRIIRLESRQYEGWYLARRVVHRGDSGYGGEFFTIIEATELTP